MLFFFFFKWLFPPNSRNAATLPSQESFFSSSWRIWHWSPFEWMTQTLILMQVQLRFLQWSSSGHWALPDTTRWRVSVAPLLTLCFIIWDVSLICFLLFIPILQQLSWLWTLFSSRRKEKSTNKYHSQVKSTFLTSRASTATLRAPLNFPSLPMWNFVSCRYENALKTFFLSLQPVY